MLLTTKKLEVTRGVCYMLRGQLFSVKFMLQFNEKEPLVLRMHLRSQAEYLFTFSLSDLLSTFSEKYQGHEITYWPSKEVCDKRKAQNDQGSFLGVMQNCQKKVL